MVLLISFPLFPLEYKKTHWKKMRTIFLIGILLFISSVTLAQEEDAAAPAGGEVDDTAGEESKAEECEEAWEYLEFLKTSIK